MLGGVYSRDTLIERHGCIKPTLYIVNTALESHTSGIHWIAMLLDVPIPEYFDSLGKKPCREFADFLGSKYTYCNNRLQSLSTHACGYHCLYFAVSRAQHTPFERIVQDMYNMDDDTVMHTVQQIQPIVVDPW
jgi:hypothetical protein